MSNSLCKGRELCSAMIDSRMHYASQLSGQYFSSRLSGLFCVEQWECAIQNLAEKQTRRWHHLASQGQSVRQKRLKRLQAQTIDLNREVEDKKNANYWMNVSILVYGAPAFAALAVYVLARPAFVRALAVWLVAEAAFLVFRLTEIRRVSNFLIPNTEPDLDDVRNIVDNILVLGAHLDIRTFLSGWFLGADFSQIKLGNLREFISYAFYHRYYVELKEGARLDVEEHIVKMRSKWNLKFEEGYNPDLKFMAHTREPLRAFHHPLIVYAWAYFVSIMTGHFMRKSGYARYTSPGNDTHFWYRPPLKKQASAGADCRPRIFIHGLGIGITPYLAFLNMLMSDHQGASVVVELPHVALRLCKDIPSVDQLVAAIEEMQKKLNLGPALYIGHSYGSLVLAHLVRTRPFLVAAVGLIDPVCFLLCLPDVVYNFVYREPRGESVALFLTDLARWYFCSKEIQVAQVLCRGFDWQKLHLWAEQLPKEAVVMLAGMDSIVPAQHVKIYLEKKGVSVIYNSGYQHAEFLFRSSAQRQFLEKLEAMRS